MDLPRREALKLLAAPVVAAAAGDLLACAHVTPLKGSTIKGNAPMNTSPLMTLKLTTSPVEVIGAVAVGTRVVYPIVGGSFEGPRLRGKVLPGGGDWTLLRPDGVLELDMRITLQTDDEALIYVTLTGIRHDTAAALYFRTTPRFETASDKYVFLNRLLAVGTGESSPGGPVHRIEEIL
jgi:hypothetical protein